MIVTTWSEVTWQQSVQSSEGPESRRGAASGGGMGEVGCSVVQSSVVWYQDCSLTESVVYAEQQSEQFTPLSDSQNPALLEYISELVIITNKIH